MKRILLHKKCKREEVNRVYKYKYLQLSSSLRSYILPVFPSFRYFFTEINRIQ